MGSAHLQRPGRSQSILARLRPRLFGSASRVVGCAVEMEKLVEAEANGRAAVLTERERAP